MHNLMNDQGAPPEARYRISDLPARIAQKIIIDPQTGCWLFQGKQQQEGYCQVWWQGESPVVHRVVYELLVGPVPDGLVLDHVKTRGCLYRHCCWPVHLEPVTTRVNVLRGYYPSEGAGDDHCLHGHLWSENLVRTPRGRYCRSCRQAYERTRPPRKRNRSRKGSVR